MSKIYKKNRKNIYVVPFYLRYSVWFLWIVVFSVFCSIITYIADLKAINLLHWFMWSIVILMLIVRVYVVIRSVIKTKSISRYVINKKYESIVVRSLLNTLNLNKLKDAPFIEVPKVSVFDRRPTHIELEIEKLVGMYDIEKLKQDINSSFKGKLANYAVTSGLITEDGLKFKFVLEDVGSDKTWRPLSIEDVKAKPYELTLQDGLKIRLDERSHIAVLGKSGSKKTTVILGLILQLFIMGADVRFLDGKDEFYAFSSFYPVEKIVSDSNAVLIMLDDILSVIKERQIFMSNESKKGKKWG